MVNYIYAIKCPHCGSFTTEENCPDIYANESRSEFLEQEKILRHMQKVGFNVVTCGDCGHVILIERS